MTENKRFTFSGTDEEPLIKDNITGKEYPTEENSLMELLNELHEEKEWLEMNNKDLVSFIKSKGYTLKDFLKYIGQFRSVGVNKEDWDD